MFRKIGILSNLSENRYPEAGIKTKILDVILQNRYQKTRVLAKVLQIIPENEISYVSFSFHSQICFKYYSFRYYFVLHLTLF